MKATAECPCLGGVAYVGVLVVSATPAFASGSDEAPVFEPYRCQIAFATEAFIGPAPKLKQPVSTVRFGLTQGPKGMTVDPGTGVPRWPSPSGKMHTVRISVRSDVGTDEVEWLIRVLPNTITDRRVIRTRHCDFVVPAEIADWINRYDADKHIDAAYVYMHELMGLEPFGGRQIHRYSPEGNSHNGNPAEGGPTWWSTDQAGGWMLGAYHHEVGHNFLGPKIPEVAKDNWAQPYIHHLTAFLQIALRHRALQEPARFGISPSALANYRAFDQYRRRRFRERTHGYRQWLESGGDAQSWVAQKGADPYAAWAWITYDLLDTFGVETLEGSLRLFRCDGIGRDVLDAADTPRRKNSLLVAAVSCAAGKDTRSFFASRGFAVDDEFFLYAVPRIRQALAGLTDDLDDGWVLGPNRHRYRMLTWKTDWDQALRAARQHEAHLLTISNKNEDAWIERRFGSRGTYWLGLVGDTPPRQATWVTGEPVAYTNWQGKPPTGNRGTTAAAGYCFRRSGWAMCARGRQFTVILERPRP